MKYCLIYTSRARFKIINLSNVSVDGLDANNIKKQYRLPICLLPCESQKMAYRGGGGHGFNPAP